MTDAIELVGVSARRGRQLVLRDVTCMLRFGVTAVVGRNGTGKSTLLRLLATVARPSRGRLRVLGHDLSTHDGRLAVRRQLGYVPQRPSLYAGFTVVEALDYVAVLKELTDDRVRQDAIRRVVDQFDLGRVAGRPLGRLPQGVHRRVALAQALLGNPGLLVLDEPAVDLDSMQREQLRQLLAAMPSTTAIVVATHRREDLGALPGAVVEIASGRVRATAGGRA